MPQDNLRIALEHGVATGQLTQHNGQWTLSPNASSLVTNAVATATGNPPHDKRHIDGVIHDASIIGAIHSSQFARWAAEKAIRDRYAQLGGFASPLGLPLSAQIPVHSHKGEFFADFRGGRIHLQDGNPNVFVEVNKHVDVVWVGLECGQKQETTDEIYGSVGQIVPSTLKSSLYKFPEGGSTWDNVGADNNRIISTGVTLYSGPPADVSFVCSLVEHDSGDIEKYKQAAAQGLEIALKKLAEQGGGEAGEVAAENPSWIEAAATFIINALTDFMGLADDPYIPQTLQISWEDMANPNLPHQTHRRNDDSHSLVFTHRITLMGKDEGGDTGEYAFYFDVRHSPANPIP